MRLPMCSGYRLGQAPRSGSVYIRGSQATIMFQGSTSERKISALMGTRRLQSSQQVSLERSRTVGSLSHIFQFILNFFRTFLEDANFANILNRPDVIPLSLVAVIFVIMVSVAFF
jgi:hypothetical protein